MLFVNRAKRIVSLLKQIKNEEKKTNLVNIYNKAKVATDTRSLLEEPVVRISRKNIEKIENVVLVFSGSGLRGLSYIPIVEFLRKLNLPILFSIGSSGGCLAAFGMASGVSRDVFLRSMEFSALFSQIDTTFKILKKFIGNGFVSLIDKEQIRTSLKKLCDNVGVKSFEDINGFFGVSSIYKSDYTLVFGRKNEEVLSPALSMVDLIYSSMAAPVSFEPLKIDNSEIFVFDKVSSSLRKRRVSSYLYDGASSSPLPIGEAISLANRITDIKTTLFLAFNLVSEVNSERDLMVKIKARHMFSDFVQGNLTASLINSLYAYGLRFDPNILIFNVNYDGSLNDIWFSDVERINEVVEKGELYVKKILCSTFNLSS